MKISAIVATYSEKSQPYLNLCLKSLRAQESVDLEIIVVSSGEYKPDVIRSFGDKINHVHSADRLHYPSAIMRGAKEVRSSTDFLVLVNDDTIANRFALWKMAAALKAYPNGVLNPLCNDQLGLSYVVPPIMSGDFVIDKRQYRLDEMPAGFDDKIIKTMDSTLTGIVIDHRFNALYFTMMEKSIFKAVGGLDQAFRTGEDDVDFALRARENGCWLGHLLDAFVFHFSGQTADRERSREDRSFSIDYFNHKHKGRMQIKNPFKEEATK